MRKLYICEYPYVLYKTLIERMSDNKNSYTLILSDSFADLEPMVPVLRQSGLFDRVEFFSSESYRDYYKLLLFDFPKSRIQKAIRLLKNQLTISFLQKRFKDIEFPFEIDFKKYDKIICTDHPCVINGYLSMNHVNYAISEHAKNSYRHGTKSLQYSSYLFLLSLLDRLHIINGICSASRYCKEIIVDNTEKLALFIHHKNLTAWNVDTHINKLSKQDKKRIFQLYANAYKLKIDENQKYDLLLTNPLYTDAYLPSEEKQIEFYRDIIRQHFNYPVLIKPHPRDTIDYQKFFPDCTVIDANISSEILIFNQSLKLGNVLTVLSSSANTFSKSADKTTILESYCENIAPNQMESLKAYW